MDLLSLLRALFALGLTFGLIGLAAYAARRWGGPMGLLQIKRPEDRRLGVVETLMLDPNRRLVLVRVDGVERLLLLGEGRWLDAERRP